jgi:hypothetical protein
MLVCGEINPPPVASEGYNGVYFSDKDDVKGKASALRGIPLRVEHNNGIHVGEILQGWTDERGAMWALAEIDTTKPHGAVTAAAVEMGNFGGFSLGYTSKMHKDARTGRVTGGEKRILELSIVKTGAHASCTISAQTKSLIHKKKL